MCLYHYRYYSACRHGQLIRITYCKKATALGLPKLDGHSRKDGGANNSAGSQPGPSSTHPPSSSGNSSSSLHSTTQNHQNYQSHNNMSTLSTANAGRPPVWDAVAHDQGERPRYQDSYIPRSAFDDDTRIVQTDNNNNDTSLLNTQAYDNVNVGISLDTKSSAYMELAHDVSHEGVSLSARPIAALEAGTVRVASEEHDEFRTPPPTIGHAKNSPRKQLPAHWLPTGTAPNLATAQRAKERTHKKGSQSGSPIEVKTLRGTRSSVDLDRAHAADGSTFLTKEALAAVENNITLPSSPLSPNRLHRSPSKPSWNSPNGSPLRSSARQHVTLSNKTSPTKSTHLNAEYVSAGHSRATSSVATSQGGGSFHTAHGSPVRSPASTEHSFMSAAEAPEDIEFLHLDCLADNDDIQARQNPLSLRSSASKANTEGRTSLKKPKLALKIPPDNIDSNADHRAAMIKPPVTASSATSISPASPVQASRIPRVATNIKSSGVARGTTLIRAQSLKSLTTKTKMQTERAWEPRETPSPKTPATRHVRTVDSSGTTPIMSQLPTAEYTYLSGTKAAKDTSAPLQRTDSPLANIASESIEKLAADLAESHLQGRSEFAAEHSAKASVLPSRATSSTAVKANPVATDPILADSAIIYSHKKSDAFGTMLMRPINIPPLMVMMAHNLDIGTLHLSNLRSDDASATTHTTSPVRGRSDRYIPTVRKQAGSENSMQSTMGSDLRATAAEFVPKSTSTTEATKPVAETMTLNDLQDLPGIPTDMTEVDRNGVPFLWYMYQMQFVYQQGFRNGRSKSPKKFKPKKQRSSLSSPVDTQQSFSQAIPIKSPSSGTSLSAAATQRLTSAELMPPPPVPAPRRENSLPNFTTPYSETTDSEPFSSQFNLVAQQAALQNRTNLYSVGHPKSSSVSTSHVDLTTIQNVTPPSGPRNMQGPNYYAGPRRQYNRHPGNGLYGGRGNAAGIRLDATSPFPNPVPPTGRPSQGPTVGREACGMIHITQATEQIGGAPCNACAPDH